MVMPPPEAPTFKVIEAELTFEILIGAFRAPTLLDVADEFFPHINRGVAGDPRVRFLWGDGRNYLLTADRRYDVILSDSIHPAHSAGNSSW